MANPPTISAALARLAGTIPDGQVAAELGIPLYTVKDYRKAANVPAFQRTPAPSAAAGVSAAPVDNAASGAAAGGKSVIRRRTGSGEINLRAPVPPAVDAQVVKPVSAAAKVAKVAKAVKPAAAQAGHRLDSYRDRMGNEPDEVIAAEAGVHRTSVGQYRRDHNVPAYRGHYEGKSKLAKSSAPVAVPVVAVPAVVAAPVVAAAVVAAKAPRKKVAKEVAAVAAPVVVTPPAEAAVVRKPNKLAGFESRIGVESDSQVAKAANCSPRLVRMYREKHGIAAPVRVIKPIVKPAAAKAAPAAAPEPVVETPAPKAARTPRAAKAAAAVVAPAVEPVVVAVVASRAVFSPDVAAPAAKTRKVRAAKSSAPKAVDPVDSESAVVAESEPVVAAPVATRAVSAPVAAVQQGFRVVAVADGVSHRFLAIGTDIGAAAARAYQSLASRPGGPWRIVKIVAGDEVVG